MRKKNTHKSPPAFSLFSERIPHPTHRPTSYTKPKPQDPYPFASSTFRWDLSRPLFAEPSWAISVWCALSPPFFRIEINKGRWFGTAFFRVFWFQALEFHLSKANHFPPTTVSFLGLRECAEDFLLKMRFFPSHNHASVKHEPNFSTKKTRPRILFRAGCWVGGSWLVVTHWWASTRGLHETDGFLRSAAWGGWFWITIWAQHEPSTKHFNLVSSYNFGTAAQDMIFL